MMKWDAGTYRLSNAGLMPRVALLLGLLGLIGAVIGYSIDREQFYFSYLTSFVFWCSLAIGALFFVMLHHLSGSVWSVVLRRLAENVALVIPLLGLFFIPILFGLPHLYSWSDSETLMADEILQKKTAFLNPTFFSVRGIIYFAVWSILALLLYRASLRQDKGSSGELTNRFNRISAPGMILFAITVTFAAFDWLMSLEAHWYSTIFGVYIFSGAVVGFLGLFAVLTVYLYSKGVLVGIMSKDHFHDLGRLLFAFIIFWAYMAFSQYFLIWYANIPEETIWFLHRWVGSWKGISLLIVFGHFVAPFFILITRMAKRSGVMMVVMGLWMLFMHWVDLYWVIMPTMYRDGFRLSWQDLSTLVGIGGVVIWFFWTRVTLQPIIPVGDPKLNASLTMKQ
jgi:hypothetical protein